MGERHKAIEWNLDDKLSIALLEIANRKRSTRRIFEDFSIILVVN